MKIFKILFLVIISVSLVGDVSTQTFKRRTIKKNNPKIIKTPVKPMNDNQNKEPQNTNLKIIAEGAYSNVEKPFVFVARSVETFTQMQNLVENLPPISGIDFAKMAIVAAFAGTKNTGGYAVAIKKAADKIEFETVAPPKDAMVTQALTTPYQVVLVPIEKEEPLPLEITATMKNSAQIYKITKGEFEYSGGITGRGAKFNAEGTIGVLSFGDFVTLIFNLSGKGTEKTRNLSETASGSIKGGKINLARLDAGSFSEGPKPPITVSGTLTKNKLLLTFEPFLATVADGFQVRGNIEAVNLK